MAPTVYLNAYYEEAEKGLPLSIITDQIVLLYETDPGIPEETAKEVQQFESVRDKIAYKLIHAGENKTLLATIPHIRYLDLAIIFYFIVAENENSVPIIENTYNLNSESGFTVTLTSTDTNKFNYTDYIYKMTLHTPEGEIITQKSGNFKVKWGA